MKIIKAMTFVLAIGVAGTMTAGARCAAHNSGTYAGDSTRTDNDRRIGVVDVESVVPDVMPQYPGGEAGIKAFLSKTIRYPATAVEEGIQGRVVVKALVGTDGNVRDVFLVKRVHPSLDKEAVRVVKLMKGFKPALKNGSPVEAWITVPIPFRLR